MEENTIDSLSKAPDPAPPPLGGLHTHPLFLRQAEKYLKKALRSEPDRSGLKEELATIERKKRRAAAEHATVTHADLRVGGAVQVECSSPIA